MKKLSVILCAVLVVAGSSFTPAYVLPASGTAANSVQQNFSFFRTHRQGQAGVTNTWSVANESGINTFVVERTYEDPTDPYAAWTVVALCPCNGSRSYKSTDVNVFPGFISYRITANFSNGNTLTTGVNTIHIVRH